MAVDANLETVASGYNLSKINDNFTKIENALENALGLDGTTPNAMLADLDLNSNDLLNGGVGNFQSVFVNGTNVNDIVGPVGPTGPAGTNGTDGINGVSFTWKGTYSGTTAYVLNDVVSDQGSSWIAINTTTGNAPPTLPTTANTWWNLAALKGDTGASGSGTGDMVAATYDPAHIVQQVVGIAATQTLTNKTLTSPVINTPTGIVKGDVGLGNVDNTSDATKNSAVASLTNKKLGSLTSNGFVKTSSGDGTLSVDTNSYQPLATLLTSFAALSNASGTLSNNGSGVLSWGSASAGMTDEQRRNALLTLCSISKLNAHYERQLNTFADGYKASDGINAGSSSNYTVNTTSGYVGPTSGSLTRVTGGTPTTPNFGGTAANINDSNTGTSITTSAIGNTTGSTDTQRMIGIIDYGSNKTITKIEAVGLSESLSTTNMELMYSTDGSTWTRLGSTIAVTTTPTTFSQTGSVTARYVGLAVAAATNYGTATVTLQDLNGYVTPLNNMTLVSTTQTADATVSNGRVLAEIDPIDSITLNTDLTVEVTCNGGTNWSIATLSSIGKGQSGRTVIETIDTACTLGTSFTARIKTLNNKNVNIYKLTVVVH